MALFSADDLDALSRPHVQRAWFAHVVINGEIRRLHTGMGPVEIAGQTWEGISDPFGGQMVGLSGMEEPRFGQAVAVDVVLSGANRDFLKAIWDDRHDIEGGQADLYFAVFDAETGDVLIGLRKVMPGKLTAPRIIWSGPHIRAIALKIVSVWEGINFSSTDAEWSPTGARQRYAGDEGLDLINGDIVENYKA